MPPTALGFALVFVAAIAGGGLAVPLKKRRQFELENIYIPATLIMMIILPLIMAAFVTPDWLEAVRTAGPKKCGRVSPMALDGALEPFSSDMVSPWRVCRWAMRPLWGSIPRSGLYCPFWSGHLQIC